MKKILVILGPTATSKTDLALFLAKRFNGELVAGDSRQVYKGLDIGTGKLPGQDLRFKKYDLRWVIDDVNVWMYDVVDPDVQYTVKNYVDEAEKVIEDILQRNKLPIIVGGTGLYLKALVDGLPNLNIPMDSKLRGELGQLSLNKLQEKLQALSPTIWEKLNNSDRHNKRRLLRSVEIIMMYPYKSKSKKSKFKSQNYDVLKIGLTAPWDKLKKRILARLVSRLDQGLIEEAEHLLKNGLTLERMKELGLEYGMLARLFSGEINKVEFINKLSVKIYQYAKRQLTWFRKELEVEWFDISVRNWRDQVEKMVTFWYHQTK